MKPRVSGQCRNRHCGRLWCCRRCWWSQPWWWPSPAGASGWIVNDSMMHYGDLCSGVSVHSHSASQCHDASTLLARAHGLHPPLQWSPQGGRRARMLGSCWWWHQAGRKTGLWRQVQHVELAHRCTQSSQSLQMWRGARWGFARCRRLSAQPWEAECSWWRSQCHVPCFPLLLSPARRRCSVFPSGIHCLEAAFPAGLQCQYPACVTHDRSLLLVDQLTAYINWNTNINTSNHYQSACGKFPSTETALLKINNDILASMDVRKVTALTFLDFSTAFDTIDHTILLQKLEEWFGVNGKALDWSHLYLAGRCQRIKIGNCLSSQADLKFGVCQGSVLGPLLFTLYIPLQLVAWSPDTLSLSSSMLMIASCMFPLHQLTPPWQ